jgi:predicted flap endonuclease-1-like 5' DNA nuclease
MRIHGVGEEYADLLEEAGVDTVKELATRNAANLAVAMAEISAKKNLTNRVPSAETVDTWISEAKKLKPMVSH